MTIEEKLAKIQQELNVPKGRKNSFGNYNYRSAEDILEALKPMEGKYNVLFIITEEIKDVAGFPYIESHAAVSNLDGDGAITSRATALIDLETKGMQMPQRTGAASSYAKKYALGNLLLIDDTQDPDATNTHGKAPATTQKQREPLNSETMKAAKKYLAEGGSMDKLKQKYIVSAKQEAELVG